MAAVLPGIPRAEKRELGRVYANACYRHIHGLRQFRDINAVIVHPGVQGWIIEQYHKALDAR